MILYQVYYFIELLYSLVVKKFKEKIAIKGVFRIWKSRVSAKDIRCR